MASTETMLQADDKVRDAVRLAQSGQTPEAITRFQEALAQAPEHAFGQIHLALALSREGRFDEACVALGKALELEPERAAFHLFAGRIWFDASDYKAARAEFTKTLELNPVNDLAQAYQILASWGAGDKSAPDRLAPERVPDSTPFMARLLMLIEMEMKGAAFEYVDSSHATPLLDRPRVAYTLWRAMMARKSGDMEKAMELAGMVSEMQPGHPAAVQLERECRQAALEQARRKVAEEPASVDARLDLAQRLAEEDLYTDAASELAEVRRLLNDRKDELSARAMDLARLDGRILLGLGRFEEALAQIEAGAEPGFTMIETHYHAGLCHLAMGRRHLVLRQFEELVSKVCWAVPTRLREYLAWRSAGRAIRT